ncbi:MAG: hypothetical protein IPG99_19400 [Ignavibacteria bacterium]|nr:hypothetical protein [Ignavibacteria bacterium]
MDNISDVRINRPPDCDGHASTFLNDDFNGDSYSDLLIELRVTTSPMAGLTCILVRQIWIAGLIML